MESQKKCQTLHVAIPKIQMLHDCMDSNNGHQFNTPIDRSLIYSAPCLLATFSRTFHRRAVFCYQQVYQAINRLFSYDVCPTEFWSTFVSPVDKHWLQSI